jgi:DNA-binding transcriptional regulator YdaS (Cro superfamily)
MQKEIAQAIVILGSQKQLAAALDCSQQNISWLLNHCNKIPAEYVLSIERSTQGVISRYQLRPDLYPEECL